MDDSDTLLDAISEALEDAGFKVVQWTSGIGVRAMILRIRPDIVVLDIHLPPLDGTEIVQDIRKHPELHRTLILLCSDRGVPELAQMAMDCGADGWVVKDSAEAVALRAAAMLLQRFNQGLG